MNRLGLEEVVDDLAKRTQGRGKVPTLLKNVKKLRTSTLESTAKIFIVSFLGILAAIMYSKPAFVMGSQSERDLLHHKPERVCNKHAMFYSAAIAALLTLVSYRLLSTFTP